MSENSQKVQKAIASFRNPYSCAQTVYAAFADNLDEEKLAYLKSMSGGRCEGGFCGALFAAREVVQEDKRAELDEFFAKNVGALTCKEIKGIAKTPCEECVKFAAIGVENLAR